MILKCSNLTIGHNNHIVLKDIDLESNQGEYVCIFGDNGSGKSTLVKTILGLLPKIKGEIVFGDDLKQRSIGYLPQKNDNLADFPASVYEVVRSGCLNRLGCRPFYGKKEVQKAKKTMEILKITNLSNRSFSELSGGQQQRVLLARALCATDKLLILDEPFTGLDGVTAKQLYETLDEINQELGVTIIIVSHFIEDILKHATKVIHLTQNCMFCGNPKEYIDHYKKEYVLSRHQLNVGGGDEDDIQ